MKSTSRGHNQSVKRIMRRRRGEKRSSLLSLFVWLIALLALVVLGWWGISALQKANVQSRLERIEAIYASLNLDPDAYAVTSYDVFGDKRPYDYDKSRSKASAVEYVHADAVGATVAELDEKIKSAGFAYLEEPYPGSAIKQYHYKSDKNEYVRLTVVSKPYWDAIRNDAILNKSFGELVTPDSFDTNMAPSNVTIKVNLDDNNE